MPGPPPKGRSSTVRCRSVEKSRQSVSSTSSSPLSRAMPTMLSCRKFSNRRGKSVRTWTFTERNRAGTPGRAARARPWGAGRWPVGDPQASFQELGTKRASVNSRVARQGDRRPAACAGRLRAAAARISPLFTGLVECTCPVRGAEDRPGARRLLLDLSGLRGTPRGADPPPRLGGQPGHPRAAASRSPSWTAAGGLRRGDRDAGLHQPRRAAARRPRARRALAAPGRPARRPPRRGHVERTGRVAELRRGRARRACSWSAAADFAARTLPKGSVAVDGVSLTVAALAADRFEVAARAAHAGADHAGRATPGRPGQPRADLLGQWAARWRDAASLVERLADPARQRARVKPRSACASELSTTWSCLWKCSTPSGPCGPRARAPARPARRAAAGWSG
jgi:hypothetical protein